MSSIEIFGQQVDAKDVRYIGMEVETAGMATTILVMSRPILIFATLTAAISAIWVGLDWSTLAMVFAGASLLAILYFVSVFVLSPDRRVRRAVPVTRLATADGEKKVVGPGTLDAGAWVASKKVMLEMEGFFGLEHKDEDGHGFLYNGLQKEGWFSFSPSQTIKTVKIIQADCNKTSRNRVWLDRQKLIQTTDRDFVKLMWRAQFDISRTPSRI